MVYEFPGYHDCSLMEVGKPGDKFLKYSCRYDDIDWFKCHNSNNTLYSLSYLPITKETCWEQIYDKICPNDPAFYQGCGHAGCTALTVRNSIKDNGVKLLCETFLCHEKRGGKFIRAGDQMRGRNDCDGALSCQNTDIDEGSQYCGEQTFYECKDSSRKDVSARNICDDKCDCRFCDDESECNGVKYGIECHRKYDMGDFVYSEEICDTDKFENCVDGSDESESDCEANKTCEASDGKTRKLSALQICAVPNNRMVCLDGLDQVNCTDTNRVALTCEIAKGNSSVSIFGVCKSFGLCNDGYDDACMQPEAGCIIHKNQICDDISDCPEGSDEKNCEDLSNVYCIRRVDMRPSYNRTSGRQELRVPLAWVSDQAIDCEDGKDEFKDLEFWQICNEGQGNLEMYVNRNDTCPIVFKCSDGSGWESFRRLCDTVNSCGTENEMCSLSRGQVKVMDEVKYQGDKNLKVFPHCSKGLQDFQQTARLNCSNVYSFDDFYSTKGRFATSTKIKLPEQINSTEQNFSCAHFYGESYVYLSCSGQCGDVVCPLKPIPLDTCVNALDRRVYTIKEEGNPPSLAVLYKEHQGKYHDEIFPCDNKNCVKHKQVCNLVNDCGDWSDERNCFNSFVCRDNSSVVPLSALCDDFYHCTDYSDECNSQCPGPKRKILGTLSLEVFTWASGVFSVLLNLAALVNCVIELRKTKTYPSMITWVLVLLISVSDLLMGYYLITIAVLNRIRGTDYCPEKFVWLTSWGCQGLGVANTMASQLSLFSMTALSISRLITVSSRKPVADLARTPKSVLKVVLVTSVVILCSAVIAFIPLVDTFEEFFVNGYYYHENPLFTASVSKSTHKAVIGSYYGRYKRYNSRSLSWNQIQVLVRDMFTEGDQGGEK